MRGPRKAFSILMGLSLLGPICLPLAAKDNNMNAEVSRNANKGKFDRAVSAIDELLGATRSNDLEMTHLFVGILPESDRIKDHLAFFQSLDSKADRAHINHKDFIYFSFPYDRLRAFRGRHFVRGDVLVIRYLTSDLSDDAAILSITATLVNGETL